MEKETTTGIGTPEEAIEIREQETAKIIISPEKEPVILKLYEEAQTILHCAEDRNIKADSDLIVSTNDLNIISVYRKSLEEHRKRYTTPIREYLQKINDSFKSISEPLTQAEQITKRKVSVWLTEVERIRKEAEETARLERELAERKLKTTGEIVDLKEQELPVEPRKRVITGTGTISKRINRKWELEDINKVPREYLVINGPAITKLVNAKIPSIPGIHIWEETSIVSKPRVVK